MVYEFGIVFGAIVLFIFVFLAKGMYLVQQAESVIVERFGRFYKVLGPGLHFITPFVDCSRRVLWTYVKAVDSRKYHRFVHSLDKIDLRESVYDFPKQNVITKDNVNIEINALLYYQITDPKAAVYEVSNLPEAIEKLTQTTLRNIIGSMDLDETLVSRDQVNEKLRIILDEATDKWGVKVNRVELQEVNPPADIQLAMEKQMRAERDRRATILESEGKKRAAILEAEGIKESEVLMAKGRADAKVLHAIGDAESRLKIAQAESEAITMIQNSVPNGDPLPYLIAMQYIKALPELTKGKDDKLIILPYEASSMIGSLASIKTMFENIK